MAERPLRTYTESDIYLHDAGVYENLANVLEKKSRVIEFSQGEIVEMLRKTTNALRDQAALLKKEETNV